MVSPGTRLVRRDCDDQIVIARKRQEARFLTEENGRLRDDKARLERTLSKARRCIAELRRSKDARISELRSDIERSDAVIKKLCQIAFPGDQQ